MAAWLQLVRWAVVQPTSSADTNLGYLINGTDGVCLTRQSLKVFVHANGADSRQKKKPSQVISGYGLKKLHRRSSDRQTDRQMAARNISLQQCLSGLPPENAAARSPSSPVSSFREEPK